MQALGAAFAMGYTSGAGITACNAEDAPFIFFFKETFCFCTTKEMSLN
jgi:hypothetical protein